MPKNKRNHFVSKAIVRFWANHKGQVLLWDKGDSDELVSRNPISVHTIDYLYARWGLDGTRDMTAESHLKSEIDDHARGFVKELAEQINSGNGMRLTIDQRKFLSRWMLKSILRSPMIIAILDTLPEIKLARGMLSTSRGFGRRVKGDPAVQRYGEQRVVDGEIMSLAATIDIDQFVNQLSGLGFFFCVPVDEARNFVLGSQPFIIKPAIKKDGDFDASQEAQHQIYLVIHPRLMVGTNLVVEPDSIIHFTDDEVLRVNGIVCKYCGSVVMHSSRDVDGAWFRPFGAEAEDDVIEIRVGPTNADPDLKH